MSTTPSTRSRKAPLPREIVFVQQQTGLDSALDALDLHNSQVGILLGRQAMQQQLVRDARKSIEDRTDMLTLNLVTEEATVASVAAMERAVKLTLMADEELGKLKQELVNRENELTETDAQLREHELGHRAAIARINAATSYLDFLRSARDARTVAEAAMPY